MLHKMEKEVVSTDFLDDMLQEKYELHYHLKNLCNVFGQGLDPVKNDCQYRAIARAKELLNKLED